MIYAYWGGMIYPTTEYILQEDQVTYKVKTEVGTKFTKHIFQSHGEALKFKEQWIGKPLFEEK